MKKRFKKIGFLNKVGWPSIIVAFIAIFLIVFPAFITTENKSNYGGILGSVAGFFANSILGISKIFGGSYAFGIIIFTIFVRLLILPLMVYTMDSQKNMAKVTPQIKKIQQKYKGQRDRDSMVNMQEETSAVYKKSGVHPFASMLPLLVQLPILWALFEAIRRTSILKSGDFLWLQLGQTDPYYILPLLAAIFTFFSTWMSNFSTGIAQTGATKLMFYVMPIIVFFPAAAFPSALSLYWVTTNAFQFVQTFFLQNPFKAHAERQAKKRKEIERRRAIRKALHHVHKRKR